MPKDLKQLHERARRLIEKLERLSGEAEKISVQARKILGKPQLKPEPKPPR